VKRPMLLNVRDKSGAEWGFTVRADPAHLPEWRAAGLEVYEIAASVPGWVAAAGMARPWAAVQAAWQWLRVF
jgi:hypothetical protein